MERKIIFKRLPVYVESERRELEKPPLNVVRLRPPLVPVTMTGMILQLDPNSQDHGHSFLYSEVFQTAKKSI